MILIYGAPGPSVLSFSTLAIDPTTGDMCNPPSLARGTDAIVMKLRSRFRMYLAEWFLDTRLGVPYREQIFIKNPPIPVINAIYRKVVINTPGILSVSSFSSTLNHASRSLISSFTAALIDGTSTLVAQAEPFIL